MSTEKIGKLLAMAEGAGTEEEANAFFAKAQSLATLYAVTLADVRNEREKRVQKENEKPVKETITVGQRGKHVNAHLCELWCRIAAANDLRINLAHNNTYVVLFGMPSDIEAAQLLFATISPQMVKFAEDYLRTDEWRSETAWRAKKVKVETYWGGTEYEDDWGMHPVTKQSARASFYSGYTGRIGRILRDARKEGIKEADEHFHTEAIESGQEAPSESRAELVLKEKGLVVTDFHNKTSTARGSWGGANGGSSSSSRAAGRSAADSTRLSGGKGIGGGSRGIAS